MTPAIRDVRIPDWLLELFPSWELSEALAAVPDTETIRPLRASSMTPQLQLIRLQQVLATSGTCELALLRQFNRIPEHLILTEVRRICHT